jgi:hypothetical protein
MNNICECWNSYILKARDKPNLTMLEMIRKKLMRKYQAKREGIEKLTRKLCPRITAKLEEIGLVAVDCIAAYVGESMFEVTCPDNRQFVVDLHRRRCGCRQWEITGIPCPHAVVAILYDCRDPEDYVDKYFTIKVYNKAYAPIIYPMPSEENGSGQVMTNWSLQEEELHLVGQKSKGEGLPMRVETRKTQIE